MVKRRACGIDNPKVKDHRQLVRDRSYRCVRFTSVLDITKNYPGGFMSTRLMLHFIWGQALWLTPYEDGALDIH